MHNFIKMHVFWQDVMLMWAMWQIHISIPTAMSNSIRPFLCQLDEVNGQKWAQSISAIITLSQPFSSLCILIASILTTVTHD